MITLHKSVAFALAIPDGQFNITFLVLNVQLNVLTRNVLLVLTAQHYKYLLTYESHIQDGPLSQEQIIHCGTLGKRKQNKGSPKDTLSRKIIKCNVLFNIESAPCQVLHRALLLYMLIN